MKYVLLLFTFLFICTGAYALDTENSEKKSSADHSAEHPDHIPHNSHGKNPVKKVTDDDE
jgi:hypothetical protein